MSNPFFIGDQEGFTPQIARLVSMMNYARQTTLQAVQGMSTEELDLLPQGYGNSVGTLLEHFVAVEKYYQAFTFGTHEDPMQALGERWLPGMSLGTLGRENIRGHDLGYYLSNLAETRAKTLQDFGQRGDHWLEEPIPFWGSTGNRHFAWFHVFEDELNHRGQIRLLSRQMPRLAHRGMTGAQFGPATPGGLGLRCQHVWEGTPAAKAGLKAGDVVLKYEHQQVTEKNFYELALAQPVGVSSHFQVQRGPADFPEILDLTVERVTPPA